MDVALLHGGGVGWDGGSGWISAATSLSRENSFPTNVNSVLLEFSPPSSNLLSMNCSFSASPSWEKVRAHGSLNFSISKTRAKGVGRASPNSCDWSGRQGCHGSRASVLPSHNSVEVWQAEGTSTVLPSRGPQKKRGFRKFPFLSP